MTVRESIRLSLIRTITPIVAGVVVLQFVRLGVDVDDATAATLVSAAISALYYAAARELETRWPRFGRLLGRATPPIYDTVDGELARHLDRVAELIRAENLRARDEAFRAGTSYPDTPTTPPSP